MQIQHNDDHQGENDNGGIPTQVQIDLALLFATDLHIGSTWLYKVKRKGTALNLRYDIDGILHQRSYLSALSWRAIMLFALSEGKTVTVHEMDQLGRYRQLFPNTLLRRLQWHAKPNANFPPVARLYDPEGSTVMLLTRSRLSGHAVDVLHNLTDGGPVFQPLWISDIMALRPVLGIELMRDEAFAPAMPISAYIEAAAMSGRIVDEPEVCSLSLTHSIPLLTAPPASGAVRSVFEGACRENPSMAKLRDRTIYEDYSFPARTEKVL